jgi:hypothetical protein
MPLFPLEAVLERTDEGVQEIYRKTNRLTQSERLVLIMVDGSADVAGLLLKLPALSMPRVIMGLEKLQEMRLVSERILLPKAVPPQQIPKAAVEKFLAQNPLDPVTVVRFDEGDLGPTTIPPDVRMFEELAPETEPHSPARDKLDALMRNSSAVRPADLWPAPAAPVSAPVPAPAPKLVKTPELAPAPVLVPVPTQAKGTLNDLRPSTTVFTGAASKAPVRETRAQAESPGSNPRKRRAPPPSSPILIWVAYAAFGLGALLLIVGILRAARFI